MMNPMLRFLIIMSVMFSSLEALIPNRCYVLFIPKDRGDPILHECQVPNFNEYVSIRSRD